ELQTCLAAENEEVAPANETPAEPSPNADPAPRTQRAQHWLESTVGLDSASAAQLATYLAAGYSALGCLPTQGKIVLERFFDEAGGMQLVIHSPFGSRINRAWGLALRKRFCRTFNFELQA